MSMNAAINAIPNFFIRFSLLFSWSKDIRMGKMRMLSINSHINPILHSMITRRILAATPFINILLKVHDWKNDGAASKTEARPDRKKAAGVRWNDSGLRDFLVQG